MVKCNIDIGDKVYIGSVCPDPEISKICNKIGTVLEIIFVVNGDYFEYKAEVKIENESHYVNIVYLYNVQDFDCFIYDGLFDDPPFNFYLDTYGVVDNPFLGLTTSGISNLIAQGSDGYFEVFALTSLN